MSALDRRAMSVTPKVQDWLSGRWLDDEHFELEKEFRWDSAVLGARVIVPARYVTDFASVPRLPLAFLLVGNTAHVAAVGHDYLYATGIFTKALSDLAFRELMELTNIPAWRRVLLYQGVNVGGQRRWDHYRRGGTRG